MNKEELVEKMTKLINEFHGHPEFLAIIYQMADVFSKKSHDYTGADSDPFINLRLSEKMGIDAWKGALVRMGDKFSRLCSFAKKDTFQVKEESVEDTLVDMANYSLICLILYREKLKDETLKNNAIPFLSGLNIVNCGTSGVNGNAKA